MHVKTFLLAAQVIYVYKDHSFNYYRSFHS